MVEILPIKHLREEDGAIFGSLNVNLAKLGRVGLPVGKGIVVSAPTLKLKTTLEHFDFGSKEVFEQTLALVKKELAKIPLPEILEKETRGQKSFWIAGIQLKSLKELWFYLLEAWIDQIKVRLWKEGFYLGVTENLDPAVIIFSGAVAAAGWAYEDGANDDVVINSESGELNPADKKMIHDLIILGNKKLFLPYEYQWIKTKNIELVGLKPFTPQDSVAEIPPPTTLVGSVKPIETAVKIFQDISLSLPGESFDGLYISSEKIYDLNKPHESFDNLTIKLVTAASDYPEIPIIFKLADKSEGMGKVRGSLRLLHQQNLLDPLIEILLFARHKKNLTNVQLLIPFVRTKDELIKIKQELNSKKITRTHSLQFWLELSVPENIINLEDYLNQGVDGVVINLDELISHLSGFDPGEPELTFYRNDVSGLLKFLEDTFRMLHKLKIPSLAVGSLSLYPEVLNFLVEKGIYGLVVEKYEMHSIKELLHHTEKRLILRRSV